MRLASWRFPFYLGDLRSPDVFSVPHLQHGAKACPCPGWSSRPCLLVAHYQRQADAHFGNTCPAKHAAKPRDGCGPCISRPAPHTRAACWPQSRGDLGYPKTLPSSLSRDSPGAGCQGRLAVSLLRQGPVAGASHLSLFSGLGLPSLVGTENLTDLSGTNDSLWLRVPRSGSLSVLGHREGRASMAPCLLQWKVGISMLPSRSPESTRPLWPATPGQSCRGLQLPSPCEFRRQPLTSRV